jgi:O-antigen/teichoic acid export membrane protein
MAVTAETPPVGARGAESVPMEGAVLRRRVLHGFFWLGSGTSVGQALSWISTIIVIRLLAPSDYGLMAMTTVFTGLVATVGEFGIGAALVQARHLTEREVRQIFGWVLLTGAAGAILAFASAPFIAAFYRQPQLVPLIQVMSFSIVLTMLYVVPQSMFVRELNFSAKAKIDVASQVVSVLFTLVFAWAGMGVWSLVAGLMSLQVIKAVLYTAAGGWTSPLFQFRGSLGLLKYGLTVTFDRLLSFLYQQSDKIIIGRVLGDALLGTYNVAQTLGMIPLEKVLPIITQVSFASYSRIQGDLERVRRNLLRSTRAVALIAFPLFFGMSAVAPFGIPLILGPKWSSVVLPFQLLCFGLPFRALGPLLGSALHGIGRPDLSVRNMASYTVTLTVAFLVTAPFGLVPVCIAWLVVYPAVFAVTTAMSLRHIELPLRSYFAEVRFPLFASLVMLGTVEALKRIVISPGPMYSLAGLVLAGMALYAALILTFKRREYDDIRSLLRR